jgi:Tfp pilus assembly protein PilO
MKVFDDLLDNIDAYYVEKSSKDRVYSYIMAVFGLGFLIYITTYDTTEKMYEKALNKRHAIQKTIKNDRRYLSDYNEAYIHRAIQDNSLLEKKFATTKYMTAYIDKQVDSLAKLVYNEKAWGEFLDSIADIAISQNIHIHELINNFAKKSDTFGHVLDLEIAFSGGFHNTMKFLDKLERTPLVVDIHEMQLTADENLVSKIKLAVWGISY